MKIIEALKDEENNIAIHCDDKSMFWSAIGEWNVLQRKKRARNAIILYQGESESEAIKILIHGE